MEKHKKLTSEGMDELTQLLATGCLRLILRQEENNEFNLLKGLDKLTFASNELDTGLTGTKKGTHYEPDGNRTNSGVAVNDR